MYPFSRSHGTASGFNPYPPRYRETFASSTILYPQAHRLALRQAFPCGHIHQETYGLTTFRASTTPRGLGSASLPRVQRSRQVKHKHLYLTPYLLVQAYKPF
jgi:hypothetical protein